MKNTSKLILMMVVAGSLAACINHADDHEGRDTVGNRYGVDTAKVEKMNTDTARVTEITGDATDVDNSGSGGTRIAKDTANKKPEPKKE